MCIVSNVSDHYGQWPKPYDPNEPYETPWKKIYPILPKKAVPEFTPEDMEKFIEALRLAREYDVANKEPDCFDENKVKPMNDAIENISKRISKAVEEADTDLAHKLIDLLERLTKLKKEIIGV